MEPTLSLSVSNNLSDKTRRISRIVFVAIGCILLGAASLKVHQLWSEPYAQDDLFPSRSYAILVTLSEVVLGVWLVSGIFPLFVRGTTLICFSVFFAISFYQAINNKPSCGCFGKIPVTPWVTATFDLITIVTLATIKLPTAPSDTTKRVFRISWLLLALIPLTIWILTTTPVSSMLSVDPTMAEFGTIIQGAYREEEIALTNNSAVKLELGSIVTSCPCLMLVYSKPSIQPGEKISAKMAIELDKEPKFVGELRMTVRVYSQEGTLLCQFRANANVIPR